MLRRLECVPEPTRDAVREAAARWEAKGVDPAPYLRTAAGYRQIEVTTARGVDVT
jgi:type I restriction enzyme M protein